MKRPTWRVNVWSTLNYHQMPWSMLWLVGGDRMDAWIGSFWGPVRRYSIFQGWVSGSSNHQRNYVILDVGKASKCNWPSLDVGKCQLLPNMEEPNTHLDLKQPFIRKVKAALVFNNQFTHLMQVMRISLDSCYTRDVCTLHLDYHSRQVCQLDDISSQGNCVHDTKGVDWIGTRNWGLQITKSQRLKQTNDD